VKDERWEQVHSFRDMEEVGINRFKKLFKEPPRDKIAELFQMVVIHMDINGHPPIPLTQNMVFHLGSFLHFWGS
jgi:hypothetical protein